MGELRGSDRGRRRPPRRTILRRVLGVAAVVVVVATVAAAVWLAHTAERARAELTAARAELGPLRAGVLAGDASVPARLA